MPTSPTESAPPPRYSGRDFPPYAYVPGGEHPHPTRDPQGHAFASHSELPAGLAASQWADCELYLYGIDLINHGYWWEAHEALEAVWVALGRNTAEGQFVQGLILLAVALLKRHQGMDEVARRMAEDGVQRMGGVRGVHMGLDVAALRAGIRQAFEEGRPIGLRLEREPPGEL